MIYIKIIFLLLLRLIRQYAVYFFNNLAICALISKGKNIHISQGVIIRDSFLSGINFVGRSSQLYNCKIGWYSYVGDYTIISNASVGKFCSIGPNVKIGPGIHPSSRFVSTSPYFYAKKDFKNFSLVDENLFEQSKYTVIGNDVWIGCNVVIVDGVKVGDGAIIAAGAIVVEDVEPFAIVAGIPARILRRRFADEQIKCISSVRWWDKDEFWLRENSRLFSNIDDFVEHHEKNHI